MDPLYLFPLEKEDGERQTETNVFVEALREHLEETTGKR